MANDMTLEKVFIQLCYDKDIHVRRYDFLVNEGDFVGRWEEDCKARFAKIAQLAPERISFEGYLFLRETDKMFESSNPEYTFYRNLIYRMEAD